MIKDHLLFIQIKDTEGNVLIGKNSIINVYLPSSQINFIKFLKVISLACFDLKTQY